MKHHAAFMSWKYQGVKYVEEILYAISFYYSQSAFKL